MRVEIIKNFINDEEIKILNDWVNLGVQNKWLDIGVTDKVIPTQKRLTTRFYKDRFEYPLLAYEISKKIRKFIGIDNFPLILGHGRNGIVVSYTMNGGDVYKHKDPRSINGLATLRCNIMTQKSQSGGQLYIDDVPIDFNVGDLHCYLASEHEHYATIVEGDTPRIMWMFGCHLPADDWNSGKINIQS
jgi:hypothetical protein